MAAEIKGARTAAGLTIEQLAEASGVSVGVLNRMSSTDIRDINVTQLDLIGKAVGVSPAELFRRAEAHAARVEMSAPTATVTELHPAEDFDKYEGRQAANAFDNEADAPEQ
jgi:transcriptional regulator with XRE-family HTH domain